jgi:glycerol kinase
MTNNKSYILAIDQGTSSTKTILFDDQGHAVAKASEPLKSYFLEGGFVEQDPEEIFNNVLTSVQKCIETFKCNHGDTADIKACGLSNQRETFVVWDDTGKPLHNAVVWQCKRSIQICERLKNSGIEKQVGSKTGLIIDPYFSGTKLIWLYENVYAVHNAIDGGNAYFGTVDTWLLFKLTEGKSYFTDYTNASRTLFFNLKELAWDLELLKLFKLSNVNLPEVRPSSCYFGETTFNGIIGKPVVVTGMIGDSHAAAFGEGCFSPGTVKATLGTGSSLLMNIGNEVKSSQNGMITTICWSTQDRVDYAFEGVVVSCGSTIEWLKNELGLINDSKETEQMATSVPDNNGVYLIPAFSGLGAPHWDMSRKASITGLTFDCNKNHVIRAALESIPYQVKDVIEAMERDSGIQLQQLMVDGGLTSNQFVMQFMADLLQRPIIQIDIADVSALGAAYMAGLKAGIYKDIEQLKALNSARGMVYPAFNPKILGWYEEWKAIVNCKAQEDSLSIAE